MHISYAAEGFIRMTKSKHSEPLSARLVIECYVAEPEFLALADKIGDVKISSIAATIRKSAGNKYAKVTAAQKYALATAILATHGTALAAYAAAFGVDETAFLAAAE